MVDDGVRRRRPARRGGAHAVHGGAGGRRCRRARGPRCAAGAGAAGGGGRGQHLPRARRPGGDAVVEPVHAGGARQLHTRRGALHVRAGGHHGVDGQQEGAARGAAGASGGNGALRGRRVLALLYPVLRGGGPLVRTPLTTARTSSSRRRPLPLQAVIYKVSKPAMTSGTGSSKWWSIRWDKRAAWANPLMGWLSSADTHQALNMHTRFESADEAIAFAERNGWKYELQRPFTRVPGRVDSMYAYNFVPVAVQVRGRERERIRAAADGRRRATSAHRYLRTLSASRHSPPLPHAPRRRSWTRWARARRATCLSTAATRRAGPSGSTGGARSLAPSRGSPRRTRPVSAPRAGTRGKGGVAGLAKRHPRYLGRCAQRRPWQCAPSAHFSCRGRVDGPRVARRQAQGAVRRRRRRVSAGKRARGCGCMVPAGRCELLETMESEPSRGPASMRVGSHSAPGADAMCAGSACPLWGVSAAGAASAPPGSWERAVRGAFRPPHVRI